MSIGVKDDLESQSKLNRKYRKVFLSIIFFSFIVLLCLYNTLNMNPDGTKSHIFGNYFEETQEYFTEAYIVKNPYCRIPNIDPYHKSIKEFVRKTKPYMCSKNKPLTTVVYSPAINRHILKVNLEAIRNYSTNMALLSCCYFIITRPYLREIEYNHGDNRYNLSEKICFKRKVDLPAMTEYIFVNCTSEEKYIYGNIHYMVADKKPKNIPSKGDLTERKYSIFLFAIDSVSRLNFMRTLPNTRKYIEKRGWLPLEGYSKVGSNTFPNVMALLTGMCMTSSQFPVSCRLSTRKPLDNCSFIWKNFSENGYLTSYSEDTPSYSTFNYGQYGFLNNPTDYYSRPVLMAAKNFLKTTNSEYCLGVQTQIEHLYQFQTELIQRFHDHPYFSILWTNSFSHDDMNMPSMMDDRISTFFADVEPYLNSTVVIFFSDHGRRFGDIRRTFVGWLEEQMPFIYIYLPPSLKKAHPSWVDNLRANKNKLTSAFDLHLTLQDLLYGHQLQHAAGCPRCGSLFSPLPHNRSCADAGIPRHECPCYADGGLESTSKPGIVAAARNTVKCINKLFQESIYEVKSGYRCGNLSLRTVIWVRSKKVVDFATFDKRENIIAFQVDPSWAVFEVTVPENTVEVNSTREVSRITMYRDESACVNGSSLLRPFCFCVKK